MTSSTDDEIVDAKALAEWLDLSAVRVAALGRENIIPRVGDRRYPLRASVRAYVTFCKANPAGRRPRGELNDEKVRLTAAQADRAEMQAARERGELVPVAEVRCEWRALAIDLRARLLAIAPRVASGLALDRATAARLDAELRAALDDIAAPAVDPEVEDMLS